MASQTTSVSTERSARLNVRIAPEALDNLREAAAAQQQDLSSFVLGAAMERARLVLMEQRVMALTGREVAQIDDALDREARPIPELAALIREVKGQRLDSRQGAILEPLR